MENDESIEDEPLEGQLRWNEEYEVEVYHNGKWLLIEKYYQLIGKVK